MAELAGKYGFEIDPAKKIYNMSVSEKQTVEILKVLYRGADILILDEPTAVLTPQETEKLFAVAAQYEKRRQRPSSSSPISSMRCCPSPTGWRSCARANTSALWTRGDHHPGRTDRNDGGPCRRAWRSTVRKWSAANSCWRCMDLTCHERRRRHAPWTMCPFDACGGEILGVAGIAGSGQKELCEAIAGLYPRHRRRRALLRLKRTACRCWKTCWA